jgi:hypothetical protein
VQERDHRGSEQRSRHKKPLTNHDAPPEFRDLPHAPHDYLGAVRIDQGCAADL